MCFVGGLLDGSTLWSGMADKIVDSSYASLVQFRVGVAHVNSFIIHTLASSFRDIATDIVSTNSRVRSCWYPSASRALLWYAFNGYMLWVHRRKVKHQIQVVIRYTLHGVLWHYQFLRASFLVAFLRADLSASGMNHSLRKEQSVVVGIAFGYQDSDLRQRNHLPSNKTNASKVNIRAIIEYRACNFLTAVWRISLCAL